MSELKVVPFTGNSIIETPVEDVLTSAIKQDLKSVIVLGYTKDDEFFLASSMGRLIEVYYNLGKAMRKAEDFTDA